MAELLKLEGVWAGYGDAVVLEDISLSLAAGESLALLGRNGMGKTTLLSTLMGATSFKKGRMSFGGADLAVVPSHGRAAMGLGWVPQERDIFPSLTVEENLTVVARPGPWHLEKIYAMFPRLQERKANMGNQLSGGEQQMLAVGRALMTNPRLLILDEATEGLAPLIREEIWQCLTRLKQAGQSILVIDKNVGALTRIADRHYVIERGKVMWKGTSAELAAAPDVQHRYLGI